MPVVNMPDGTPVNFPDDMPKEQIRSMIAAKFPDAVPKAPEPKQQVPSVARTVLDQGLQGGTFGFADEITDRLGALSAKLQGGGNYGDLLKEARGMSKDELSSELENRPVLSVASNIGGGLLTGGAGASTKAGKAVASSLGSGGLLARAAKGAAAGATSGAAFGAGTADDGNMVEGAIDAAPLGGLLGGALPVAGKAISSIAKPVTPAINEGKKEVAILAQKYNIPLGLDNLSDSKFYKGLISEGESIPLSGSTKQYEAQQSAFTKAIARSIGLDDVDSLTPENMNKAYTSIGKQFDDLTKGKTFALNDDVQEQFLEIGQVADGGGYGAEGLKLYDKYMADIQAGLGADGTMKGETLAKIRGKLNKITRNASDQNAKTLAGELESAISDFIAGDAPEALKKAKYQYKNFIAIEPLAQKAQVDGSISPAALTSRVASVYKRQFTKGEAGELGDLARIGQLIKQQVPNSGTAQRTTARNILTGNLGIAPAMAFANPVVGLSQAGISGLSMAANRGLQSRNYNPATINKALGLMAPKTASPISGLLSGYTGNKVK